jgi:hypothetical protein
VDFGDHVLEPISLIVKLALRLGAGAAKAHHVTALHQR